MHSGISLGTHQPERGTAAATQPTDLSSTPSSREVRLAGHVASRYPTVTCQLQTLHDRWSPNGRDYAIMRLCSSLLPSFGSGEVP